LHRRVEDQPKHDLRNPHLPLDELADHCSYSAHL
jgi:hypothetical protein